MILPLITIEDLKFINDLSSRKYEGNTMISNATEEEKARFKSIKHDKLKVIAQNFKMQFDKDYGLFDYSISTGNPLSRSGSLNRLWSGIFKGANHKQYSAQISFVVNPIEECLDLGFYFGRASSRSDRINTTALLERMKFLGRSLSEGINENPKIYKRFQELFDNGFNAYYAGKVISPDLWIEKIKNDPRETQIITKLYANDNGVIESSKLTTNVAMIIFLMNLLPSVETNKASRKIRPLTPEQRAEQAARRTLIGYKGELFVIEKEKEKIQNMGLDSNLFLKHVAMESDSYGYDIKSCDSLGNTIYIEVKTTTRIKKDSKSDFFYMSSNERDFYLKNKKDYYLYRVYGIESNNPEFDIIDLKHADFLTDNFKVQIKTA